MLSDSNSPSAFLWLIQGHPYTDAANVPVWGERWARFFAGQSGINQVWVAQVDENRTLHWIANWPSNSLPHQFSDESLQNAAGHGKVFIYQDYKAAQSGGLFPLIHNGRVIGLICLLSHQADHFKPDTIQWISALTTTIAYDLFQEEFRRRERQADHSIFQIMQSSPDVHSALPIALEILAGTLKADGIVALACHRSSQQFELLLTHGLNAGMLAKLPTRLASDLVDELQIKGNRPIWIEDLWNLSPGLKPINKLGDMGFRGYLALPLITHSGLTGVLEIFWRAPLQEETYQLDFLNRISDYFAFAMEHNTTLMDLQHNNQMLASKYNALIEGLSRTLELRDLETEGHTQRVCLLTMRLVEHMKIPQKQWDDIRRGAMLHDIGKIGIPDAILLKPGSLTDQERRMMQLHVTYAYNILSPIITSRHTLDIVHYHHEHWNGKGYPDGLKDRQIPLVARLFSVVDVFDALTSDRPYRPAWSRSHALSYLKDQAGIQFDPDVIKAFLEIEDRKL